MSGPERTTLPAGGGEEARYRAVAALDPDDAAQRRELLERLGDRSWRVRMAAVDRLSRVADPGPVVRPLVTLLGSGEDPGARAAAAAALVHIGRSAVPAVAAALQDPSPETRCAAAETLGDLADRGAAAALAAALADPYPNVGASAAEALGKIGGPEAAAALQVALGMGEAAVRQAALAALARLKVAPPLTRIAALLHDRALRRAAYRLLGASDDPRAVALLVEGLTDAARGGREGALAAVAEQRERRDPAALAALARAVRQVADANPALADGAAAALLSPEFEVAAGALAVLGWTRAVRHAPAIARAAEDERLAGLAAEALEAVGPAAGAALGDTARSLAPEARMAVMGALARLGDASVLSDLVDFVGSDEEHLRAAAIEALGRLGDLRALPLLVRLLGDGDAAGAVAGAALERLAVHDEAARRAVLEECRPVSGPAAPPALLRLLGALGDPDDLPALRRAVAEGEAPARAAAASALGAAPRRFAPAVLPDLLGALDDAAPAVRAAAAQAIGRAVAAAPGTGGEPAAEAERALISARRDREPVVCAAAAEALGRAGCRGARAALEALLRSAAAAPEAAVAALHALGAIGSTDPEVLASAARHPDPEVVKEAVSLAAAAPGPAGATLLLAAAAHARWDVRQAAARAISSRGDRALLGPLRRLAAAEEDPLVATAFADAARRLEALP